MNRMRVSLFWATVCVVLAGCTAGSCGEFPDMRTLFRGTTSPGLSDVQIRYIADDFCSKYSINALRAGQTGARSDIDPSTLTAARMQPNLSVTVDGVTRSMDSEMARTIHRYLQNVDASRAGECSNVVVISDNSVIFQLPDSYGGIISENRRENTVEVHTSAASSVWQRGTDGAWRMIQIHMSSGPQTMSRAAYDAITRTAVGEGAEAAVAPRGSAGDIGW